MLSCIQDRRKESHIDCFSVASSNEKLQEEITLEATNTLDNVNGRIYVLARATKLDEHILDAQNRGARAIIALTSLSKY